MSMRESTSKPLLEAMYGGSLQNFKARPTDYLRSISTELKAFRLAGMSYQAITAKLRMRGCKVTRQWLGKAFADLVKTANISEAARLAIEMAGNTGSGLVPQRDASRSAKDGRSSRRGPSAKRTAGGVEVSKWELVESLAGMIKTMRNDKAKWVDIHGDLSAAGVTLSLPQLKRMYAQAREGGVR